MKQHKTGIGPGLQVALFLLCVVLVFMLRSLWTHPTEHGDAIQKYFWAAEILRSGDWSNLLHNHHTLRWAMMLPQIGLTWLLGARYELFYILPLLLFSLYIVLIIFGLKKVFSLSQIILLGTILFVDPWGLITSNQLLNPPAGILFSLAGVFVLVSKAKHQNLAVMLSATLFFIAYGAHVTYLSFAAGGFLWLVFFQRKWSRAAIYCGTLLSLMTIEVLTFNYLSGWQLTLGRLELLAGGTHIHHVMNLYEPVAPVHLLTRWLRLLPPELVLCLIFFAVGPWLFLQRIKGKPGPAVIECIYLVGLCFALSITFAVISINPIRPMMPLRPMYLVPFLPFASIMTVYMWSILAARIAVKNRTGKELLASLVLVSGLWVAYGLVFQDRFLGFMWKADREYTAYSDKFQRGELLLTGQRKIVYGMIAKFKHPVKTVNRRTGISVIDPSPRALCVDRLNKSPLDLNYQACEP